VALLPATVDPSRFPLLKVSDKRMSSLLKEEGFRMEGVWPQALSHVAVVRLNVQQPGHCFNRSVQSRSS
jgi:hypothetical protein